jgi:hypothetical protein
MWVLNGAARRVQSAGNLFKTKGQMEMDVRTVFFIFPEHV